MRGIQTLRRLNLNDSINRSRPPGRALHQPPAGVASDSREACGRSNRANTRVAEAAPSSRAAKNAAASACASDASESLEYATAIAGHVGFAAIVEAERPLHQNPTSGAVITTFGQAVAMLIVVVFLIDALSRLGRNVHGRGAGRVLLLGPAVGFLCSPFVFPTLVIVSGVVVFAGAGEGFLPFSAIAFHVADEISSAGFLQRRSRRPGEVAKNADAVGQTAGFRAEDGDAACVLAVAVVTRRLRAESARVGRWRRDSDDEECAEAEWPKFVSRHDSAPVSAPNAIRLGISCKVHSLFLAPSRYTIVW